MPTPANANAALRRTDLEGVTVEFDLQANMDAFIGLEVMPPMPTRLPSSEWKKIKVESLLLKADHGIRAPRAGFQRADFEYDTDNFMTYEYGVEEFIDRVESAFVEDYWDAEVLAAMRARHRLLMLHEIRVAGLVFNETAANAEGMFTDVSGARPWSNPATATPRADVRAAKIAYKSKFGFAPNAIVLSDEAVEDVIHSQEFIDDYQGGGTGQRAMDANRADVAKFLGVDRIIEGAGQMNTANEGAAAVYAPIWSNSYAALIKIPRTRDIHEPCFGRTFQWTRFGGPITGRMESYYEAKTDNDIVRARHYVGEKVIYQRALYLLQIRP